MRPNVDKQSDAWLYFSTHNAKVSSYVETATVTILSAQWMVIKKLVKRIFAKRLLKSLKIGQKVELTVENRHFVERKIGDEGSCYFRAGYSSYSVSRSTYIGVVRNGSGHFVIRFTKGERVIDIKVGTVNGVVIDGMNVKISGTVYSPLPYR